jgi:RsiW-degrading membrane proteinase PrsW (M82 family)
MLFNKMKTEFWHKSAQILLVMGFSGVFFLIAAVANAQSIQTRAQAEELIQSSAITQTGH